jgi:hypothetical protein
MIGRTFDLEVSRVLPVQSFYEDSETARSAQPAWLPAQDDAARAPRNNRSVGRPLVV